MVSSRARTVAEYLASLDPEHRKVIATVRASIRKHLPRGYAETMNWGMIAYEIPLKRYPDTYNGQPLMLAALARQKNNYAVYLMCVNSDPKRAAFLRQAFEKIGRKADTGKSCIRFKRLEELPVEAIGEVIGQVSVDDYLAYYEKSRKKKK